MITLSCKNDGTSHVVFDTCDPKTSTICGIIKKLEPGFWEWQIKHRRGGFDVANSCYKPSLIRYGYANHREKALRQVIDYIKSGVWDE